MNARRNIRPSSRRTGMLCRFGRSELSRPVRATVWLNVAWMRPSDATSASRPSPYVPRSFSTSRYCSSGPMNSGHWSRSFSSVAASVDAPVFVRLHRRQPTPRWRRGVQQLAQLDRRVDVQVVPPDDFLQLGLQALDLAGQPLVEPAQLDQVDGDPGVFHACQHAHQRVLDAWRTGRPCPGRRGSSRSARRAGARPGPPDRRSSAARPSRRRDRAAPWRPASRPASRTTCTAPRGGPGRSGPQPGPAGRRRSPCRAAGW